MKRLKFSNGDSMPVLGLGTWLSKPGEVYTAVKEAIKVGYRHIDCAAVYGNEKEVGKALNECFEQGLVKREEMWITSKLWNDMHAPEDVEPAIRNTLADLQLEYLDLYLIHWPVSLKKGVSFPADADGFVFPHELSLETTWAAMEALVDKKLTKHIGVSNFSAKKIQNLIDKGSIKPEVNQVEMHPYLKQHALVEFCHANDIFLTAYSPLGSPGRPDHMKGKDELDLLGNPTVVEIAKKHKVSPGQVLISWSIHRGISVIPKSVNPARIKQNLKSADLELSAEDMLALSELNQDRRYVTGDFWVFEGGPFTVTTLWDE